MGVSGKLKLPWVSRDFICSHPCLCIELSSGNLFTCHWASVTLERLPLFLLSRWWFSSQKWSHKTSPTLYRLLGIFLPLITTNVVLGVALLNLTEQHNFMQSLIYGFALWGSLLLVLFAPCELAAADVPVSFKGASIAMITAGLMSLTFMGFSGLVKV